MRKYLPFRSGFTLIETLVVIALSAIMFVVLVDLYRAYTRMYSYQKGITDTAGSATKVANDLQTWVLQSSAIEASALISGTTYTTGTTTLVLQIPSIDSSGNVIANTYDSVAFYTGTTTIYRVLSPNPSSSRIGGTKLLSETLSTLTFTYNTSPPSNANQITIAMRMQTTSGKQLVDYDLTQKLYVRNK